MSVKGESLLLAQRQPANLCFDHVVKGSLILRGSFMPGGIVYEEGRDYEVDYITGTVTRTAASRIPDYSRHCLYGQKNFNQNHFKKFKNHKWFVWADYQTSNGSPWALPSDQREYLQDVRKKLEAGGTFTIVSYGDSITSGGEASKPEFRFTNRFANYLQTKFPLAKITLQDISIPGYCSKQGVDWFDKKFASVKNADLVLVGFGMNDHNSKWGQTPKQFATNLTAIIRLIRERVGANIILFSAFPPNDNWFYSSHRMEQYADVTRQTAKASGCAYADVYGVWEMVLRRKDQSSLLGNNINHPNDFGHWLYEQAFEAVNF